MLVTGLRGHVLGIDVGVNHPVKLPHVRLTGVRGKLSGIQADGNGGEGVAIVERFLGKPLVDRLHDFAPQHRRGVGADVDLLGLVVAHPDRGGIMGGIAAEPPITVGGGGAGLAGNGLTAEQSRAAGAVVGGVVQAVVHIIDGLLA